MQNVLVTGAANGIGKACCDIFYQNGYQVLGIDKESARNSEYEIIEFDLSRLGHDEKTDDSFFGSVENRLQGRLDALINNAAIQIVKSVEAITMTDWSLTLNTNLLAPFFLIQHLLPQLKAVRGSVVNIASIHAHLTKSNFSMYATSKGALLTLTRSLALELAPEVRVNAVLPAATNTKMLREGFEDHPNSLKKLGTLHPLQRIAYPNEISCAAYFLAGTQARFITGAALNVDGGIGVSLLDP
jgi:NAD(P)-dependent dehydrogenase (short-subunit alcohol dehydrogenase family)